MLAKRHEDSPGELLPPPAREDADEEDAPNRAHQALRLTAYGS